MKRSNSSDLVAAVSKRASSSSSMMDDDDDTEPQSFFVVVSYSFVAPFFSSIVQLGTQVNNHLYDQQYDKSRKIPVTRDRKVFSSHFSQPYNGLPVNWAFSPLASCSEDLYMVPDCCFTVLDDVRLHGYKFNLRTNEFKRIPHPLSSKINGNVVSLRDSIYFMPPDDWICDPRPPTDDAHPILERYNPLKDSWEPRKPFPVESVDRRNGETGKIVATAVWDDTILMNIDACHMWAYNGGSDKWYRVNVDVDKDYDCYCIVGEAVVVENKTIYALTRWKDSETILALSVKIEASSNRDLEYTCSLLSKISVPGMLKIKFDQEDAYWMTRHLVHLGKDNFCLVQSCHLYGLNTCQPIQVTYMKKLWGQNEMTVTKRCIHQMKIVNNKQFTVRLCFSPPPECKTIASKHGKNEPNVFNFDPFSADFDPKDYADTKSVFGSGKRSPSPPGLYTVW